jgi:Tfp pilus assembly protein PilE
MNIKTSPAVAQLGKFRSKLAASEAEGVKGALNQLGINMVDLMMWLVIAALLLAAALQGIGYYQQAAWTYQAKSDVASVRTYMEAQFTLNNNLYPDNARLQIDKGTGDLKLTGDNTATVTAASRQGWTAAVQSPALKTANKGNVFTFASKDVTSTADSDEGSNNPKASGDSSTAAPTAFNYAG